MTPAIETKDAQELVGSYLTVLGELTDLAETEGTLLGHGSHPLPLSLVQRKERLVSAYAALTAAVKARAGELSAVGLLDTADLEIRIRRLVFLTKENQRRLNAGKERSVRRVDAVMNAIGHPNPGANDTGPRELRRAANPQPPNV